MAVLTEVSHHNPPEADSKDQGRLHPSWHGALTGDPPKWARPEWLSPSVALVAVFMVLAILLLVDGRGRLQPPWRLQLRATTCLPGLGAAEPAAPRIIYILRGHELNGRVWSQYEAMRADLGEWVFLLVADTAKPMHGMRVYGNSWARPQKQVLLVNEEECKRASSLHTTMYVAGQTPLALVGKYFQELDYDYIWFVDWDAVCNGNYSRCFTMPRGFDHGFVATYTGRYGSSFWHRWEEMTGELAKLPLEKRWKSLFPIVRLSKSLLDQIYLDLNNTGGLCELYVPTFCAAVNCTVGELPAGVVGEVRFVDTHAEPDFRCQKPNNTVDHKWYHPCKK